MSVLLVSAAALGLSAGAHASIIQTQTFSQSVTVTDAPGGGYTQASDQSFAHLTFNQFDPVVGVLTAVKFNLTSTRMQTTVLSGTPSGTGTLRNTGTNSTLGAHFGAPGLNAGIADITQTGACGTGGTSPVACPRTLGSTSTATNATYNGVLANYLGTGTFNAGIKANVKANDATSGGTWTGASDKYTSTWTGSVALQYFYDQHSQASFNSSTVSNDALTLDFGTVSAGSPAKSLLFDIYNLLKNDPNAGIRLDMNYDASTSSGSGDVGAFSFSAPFSKISDLKPGKGDAFGVTMATDKVGWFDAIYTIGVFDDTTQIAGVGYAGNTLTLEVKGHVVPEPGALSLLGGGLMLLGSFGLKRRARAKA